MLGHPRSLLRDPRQELLQDIAAPHLLHLGLVSAQLRIDGNPCRSALNCVSWNSI